MNVKNRIISLMMAIFMVVGLLPYDTYGATGYKQPHVIETEPKAYDWFVDKRDLYKSFLNGESGDYMTVVFDNKNNDLKTAGDNIDLETEGLNLLKEEDENLSLLDESRSIVYEGFKDNKDSRIFKLKTSGRVIESIDNPYTSAQLYLDNDSYEEHDTIRITLFDNDLNQNKYTREEATVRVTRGDETKEITLRETGINTARFEGSIKVWEPFDKNNKENESIEIRYIDVNSADMSTEKVIVETATIRDKVTNKRESHIYIDKKLYEKDEKVNIIMKFDYINGEEYKSFKNNPRVEAIYNIQNEGENIDPNDRAYILLKETDKNTGVFEGDIKTLKGDFDIIYTYEKKETPSLRGEAKVHIPIKNLEDNTIYKASIPEGLVKYDVDKMANGEKEVNSKYEWTFKTSVASKTDVGFQASAPEAYDSDYFIVLNGTNYSEETRVYFRNQSGYEYRGAPKLVDKRTDILHVYPPTGRNRLKVGLYDIIVENNKSSKEVIEYGVLSVVPKGDYIPNEDYVETDKDINGDTIREGDLKKYIKTSSDTLELSSRYSDDRKLEFDLDEIMGEDVWTRNIAYRGYRNDTIGRLITESKWADIELRDVTLDTSTGNRDIKIRLGRTEPSVMEMIKKRINDFIKSDFIQISGENYEIDSAELSIPYKESNGNNLKVLRYDEDTRRIGTNISFRVDKANKKVEITNAKKGIYVIVQ